MLSSAVSLGESARGERGELAARHVSCVSRGVAFLLTHDPARPLAADQLLFERLLNTLLLGNTTHLLRYTIVLLTT